MKLLTRFFVAILFSAPHLAAAQEASEQEEQQQDGIVVQADRTERSIGRNVFVVTDSPARNTANAIDVLRGIPSLVVGEDNAVSLLGGIGAEILVDGQRFPNIEALLTVFPAVRIDRVEVVRNPSAEFRVQAGTAIINIITERSLKEGFTSLNRATMNNFGTIGVDLAPDWSRDGWKVNGLISYFRRRTPSFAERMILRSEVDPSGSVSDRQRRARVSRSSLASLDLDYDLSNRSTVSLAASLARDSALTTTDLISLTGITANSVDEALATTSIYRLEYQNDISGFGKLSVDASSSDVDLSSRLRIDHPEDGRSTYDVDSSLDEQRASVKLEEVTKFDLQVGIEASRVQLGLSNTADGFRFDNHGSQLFHQAMSGQLVGTDAFLTGRLDISDSIAVKPGVRLERRSYRTLLAGSGYPVSSIFLNLLPALHAEFTLANKLPLIASYTRRYKYPSIVDLAGIPQVKDQVSFNVGNPDLIPSSSDRFDLSLEYTISSHRINMSYALEILDDVKIDVTDLLEGDVLLIRPENAGGVTFQAVSIDASGQLVSKLTYGLGLSCSWSDYRLTLDRLDRYKADECSGAAKLTYREAKGAARHSDEIEISLDYSAPTLTPLKTTKAQWSLDASWSHQFSDGLTLSARAQDLLSTARNKVTYRTPDSVVIVEDGIEAPRFELVLALRFPR